MDNSINCPQCGKEIQLQPKEGNPARLIAFCYCDGRKLRAVYETDAPVPPVKSKKEKES